MKNEEIRAQRLSPEEIVALEQGDPERFAALEKNCTPLIFAEGDHAHCDHLFHCGAGLGNFIVSYDGLFRLCSALWHADCIYNLRRGSLRDAWENFLPRVREMSSQNRQFLENCRGCALINLCMWCPAHACLETGKLDAWVEYFCRVAQARARALGYKGR